LALDTHLRFSHRLQQRRLRARRRAIDFIGQQNVGEDRALMKKEMLLALIKHRNAKNVRRQEIWRELDAGEFGIERPGEGFRESGFAGTGKILEQYVSPA